MTSISDLVPTLELGQRVAFSATLRRVTKTLEQDRERYSYRGRKVWERRENGIFRPNFAREGIVVGARTLYDGVVEYGWEDNPTTFKPDRSHRVYLVATSLRTNPVIVALEDIDVADRR